MATTMDTRSLAGPAFLAIGIGLLGAGFARGEATLSLVLVIPVVTATGVLSFLGILLIVLGFFTTFWFWPARLEESPSPIVEPVSSWAPPSGPTAPRERRWGGVVFLGPVPIVFGSEQRVTRFMLVLGIVLFLALLALSLFALMT